MSALLPQGISAALLQAGAESLALGLGVLAILLLVTLLIEREVLRAAAGDQPPAEERPAKKVTLLDVAIVPLVMVFSFVVLEHFYRLIF